MQLVSGLHCSDLWALQTPTTTGQSEKLSACEWTRLVVCLHGRGSGMCEARECSRGMHHQTANEQYLFFFLFLRQQITLAHV